MIYKDNVPPERLPEILKGCLQKVKEVMGCNITFTNKVMDEGYDLPPDASTQSVNVELLLRKGSLIPPCNKNSRKKWIRLKPPHNKNRCIGGTFVGDGRANKRRLGWYKDVHAIETSDGKTISGSANGRDIAYIIKPSPPCSNLCHVINKMTDKFGFYGKKEEKVNKIKTSTQQNIDTLEKRSLLMQSITLSRINTLVERWLAMGEKNKKDINDLRIFIPWKKHA
ncbi:adk [Mytilus coruscus]|uniref:Adk n=1 Tax=Mytilus coruscus TaxID=42192 RepID=A0A6J8D9S3_MYTCO|nr:adk [Mytilus coruscus]